MRIKKIFRPLKVKLGSDRSYIKKRYKKIFGFEPNLDNPTRFSEVINWIKINNRNNLHSTCSDKLAVRDFVKKTVNADILIPLLAHGARWVDLNYCSLKEPFIIKTNHGSGQVRIIYDKRQENETDIRKDFESQLKENYYYGLREWQYKNIQPKILVEKLLQAENGLIPDDYKFHCFNNDGAIELVLELISGRPSNTRGDFYTESWDRLPFELSYPKSEVAPEKPANFPELCAIARQLSKNFQYVRVDLYTIGNKIYFGELTFTPTSGVTRFQPDNWDFIFGKKILDTGIIKNRMGKLVPDNLRTSI